MKWSALVATLLSVVLLAVPVWAQSAGTAGPAIPDGPGIAAFCGALPPVGTPVAAPTGAANIRYLRAFLAAGTALGNGDAVAAANGYWAAYTTWSTPEVGRQVAVALRLQGAPARVQLCAVLACVLAHTPASALRTELSAWETQTACNALPVVVQPVGPAVQPPSGPRPLATTPHSALVRTVPGPVRTGTPVATRSVVGYVVPAVFVGGGVASLVASVVTGLRCADANATLTDAIHGQTDGWPRDVYASAANNCYAFDLTLSLGLALAAAGVVAWPLMAPSRPPAVTVTPVVAPSPHAMTGVNLTVRF